jgi:hypothetical protein
MSGELPETGRTTPPFVVVLLVTVALASAAATLLVPDLLSGVAAMNGSAKGTALVVSLGGAPLVAASYRRAASGSLPALTLAAGGTAYLVYNAVLLLFATPLNRAFLLYVALLGLGIWALAGMLIELWRRGDRLPAASRWAAGFLLVVVALNGIAWASRLVPALLSDDPRSVLDGTGLDTSAVYVQDLAFWLPAIAWVGVGMWRAHGPRTALGAAVLCFWVLESAGVAADQWWGHRADPSSSVVSGAAVPIFVVMAVLSLWPWRSVLRTVRSGA